MSRGLERLHDFQYESSVSLYFLSCHQDHGPGKGPKMRSFGGYDIQELNYSKVIFFTNSHFKQKIWTEAGPDLEMVYLHTQEFYK